MSEQEQALVAAMDLWLTRAREKANECRGTDECSSGTATDYLVTYLPPFECGCEPHDAVCHGDVVERLALEVKRLRETLELVLRTNNKEREK